MYQYPPQPQQSNYFETAMDGLWAVGAWLAKTVRTLLYEGSTTGLVIGSKALLITASVAICIAADWDTGNTIVITILQGTPTPTPLYETTAQTPSFGDMIWRILSMEAVWSGVGAIAATTWDIIMGRDHGLAIYRQWLRKIPERAEDETYPDASQKSEAASLLTRYDTQMIGASIASLLSILFLSNSSTGATAGNLSACNVMTAVFSLLAAGVPTSIYMLNRDFNIRARTRERMNRAPAISLEAGTFTHAQTQANLPAMIASLQQTLAAFLANHASRAFQLITPPPAILQQDPSIPPPPSHVQHTPNVGVSGARLAAVARPVGVHGTTGVFHFGTTGTPPMTGGSIIAAHPYRSAGGR